MDFKGVFSKLGHEELFPFFANDLLGDYYSPLLLFFSLFLDV